MLEIAKARFIVTKSPAIPDKPNKVLITNANIKLIIGPINAIFADSMSEA